MGYYSTLEIELPLEFSVEDDKAMIAIEALKECIDGRGCMDMIKLLYKKDEIPEIFNAERAFFFFRNKENNTFLVEDMNDNLVIKGNIKINSCHKDYDNEIKKFYKFIIPYVDNSIEDGKIVGKYKLEDNRNLYNLYIKKYVDGPISIEVENFEEFQKELDV